MADALFPTPTRLGLLRDIADGKVADDAHLTPMLDLGDGMRTKVSHGVWELSQAGWCQPTDTSAWELTDAGRAVLDGGTDD